MILTQHGISSLVTGGGYRQGWTEDENVTTSLGHDIPVDDAGIDVSLLSVDKLAGMQLVNDSCGIDMSLVSLDKLSPAMQSDSTSMKVTLQSITRKSDMQSISESTGMSCSLVGIRSLTATIGGRVYPTVTIGNQTWLAENLDFKFSGLTVGSSSYSASEPMANYYNNDETTYGVDGNKYGLLYNWPAVKYINDNRATLCPGWHVPTEDEIKELWESVGGRTIAGTKLKSTTGWVSGNGDGSYGFNAYPTGCNNSASGFIRLGEYAYFWTITRDTTQIRYVILGTSAEALMPYQYPEMGFTVRLVKDSVTPPPGPTPSYNYVLLNQFVSPMPSTTDAMDFTNEVPADFTDQSTYQTDDLVSVTAGDPMIDTDAPVDFTAQSISTGTPVGIIDFSNPDYDWINGPNYSLTAGALSNGFTLELWYKAVSADYNPWLAVIGTDSGSGMSGDTLFLNLGGSYDAMTFRINGSSVIDYDGTMSGNWNDGAWHHYAVCYDATAAKVYLFADGAKLTTVTTDINLISGVLATANTIQFGRATGSGEVPFGRYAQAALCDSCKWDDDFTVPTTAY